MDVIINFVSTHIERLVNFVFMFNLGVAITIVVFLKLGGYWDAETEERREQKRLRK